MRTKLIILVTAFLAACSPDTSKQEKAALASFVLNPEQISEQLKPEDGWSMGEITANYFQYKIKLDTGYTSIMVSPFKDFIHDKYCYLDYSGTHDLKSKHSFKAFKKQFELHESKDKRAEVELLEVVETKINEIPFIVFRSSYHIIENGSVMAIDYYICHTKRGWINVGVGYYREYEAKYRKLIRKKLESIHVVKN